MANTGLNDFHVLNVNTWSWLDYFSASGNPPSNNNNNGGTSISSTTTDPSSLSSGAIAGIVVGVVALVNRLNK